MVVVGDFEFPVNCYCPNIPVPTVDGLRIYPLKGQNVYMSGPDIYLALMLGAKIRVFRGFKCQVLKTSEGRVSKSLSYAVSNLVRDRIKAKKIYKGMPIVEKSLKIMVNSC
jgi:hypothetical protein